MIFSHMTMSLDGFIADPDDGVAELFGWYNAGTVTVPSADERWSFTVDERSAELLRSVLATTGAHSPASRAPHRFDDPVVIPGHGVTHLRYRVRRD